MSSAQKSDEKSDAIAAELFQNRFSSLATEMGEMLRRMALSTNVKERLDFSCGLLDPEGRLVVNAPHIPVHLGALGLCVRSVAQTLRLGPGDVAVTNHPAWGGSHLPDVTMIMPVHSHGTLLGFVANRAHHAEIGGQRPGSMPPNARTLAEEGVVIRPTLLTRSGSTDWQVLESLLSTGRYPSRSPGENLADLRAALAANLRGATKLEQLADRYGSEELLRQMAGLRERSAHSMRRALLERGSFHRRAEERLDDGSALVVDMSVDEGRCRIDFTGTAGIHPGNLNATPAIATSAVLYVLRLLLDQPLPLNEGLLEPVQLVIPRGMLNPEFPEQDDHAPAVVGGNVETSQRLVDTLIKALGLSACSQGTMNNFLFGNDSFGYYETICGGAGAGPGFDGASAVHTHMTNTRITDPEVLELRYPVTLERFEVRRGSGGRGRYRGGDGAIRRMLFHQPVSASFLSQHRKTGPFGGNGGEPGACGAHWIERADGSIERLEGVAVAELAAGDRVVIETPGGGGWGRRHLDG